MKIAIVGSRTFKRPDLVADYISKLPKDTIIISGAAHGPDAWAAYVAEVYELPEPMIFWPNWKIHGIKAGFIRNHSIVENCDKLVAFYDGKSRGTKHSMELARKYNKNLEVIRDTT